MLAARKSVPPKPPGRSHNRTRAAADCLSAGVAESEARGSEAVQHPTTLYPAAVSILGSAYSLLLNFNPTVLAVVLGVVCMLGLGKIDDKPFIDNIYRIYKQ